MVSTGPTRHQHRHQPHELLIKHYKLLLQARLHTYRDLLRSKRFVLIGSFFLLIALCALFVLEHYPLIPHGHMRFRLPRHGEQSLLLLAGGLSAVSGVIVLRSTYRGRVIAAFSLSFVFLVVSLLAVPRLFAHLQSQLTYVPVTTYGLRTVVTTGAPSTFAGPAFTVLVVLGCYTILSIFVVKRTWGLLKGDRRTHRRPSRRSRRSRMVSASEDSPETAQSETPAV